MCSIFGIINYGDKISHHKMKKLLKHLSIAAEERGTHATGIAYVKKDEVVIDKHPKAAHKCKFKFPHHTKVIMGHTRYATQGAVEDNYNNHPFPGHTSECDFAFAHNGVLYNDVDLRQQYNLPATHIKTDSYIGVQLIEKEDKLDFDSLKFMAENVLGSFMFTALRDDNTLFLVKGDNPIAIYEFEKLGIYVYASTHSILETGLKKAGFNLDKAVEWTIEEGEIWEVSPNGIIASSTFDMRYQTSHNWNDLWMVENEYDLSDTETEWLIDNRPDWINEDDIWVLLDEGCTFEQIWEIYSLTQQEYEELWVMD